MTESERARQRVPDAADATDAADVTGATEARGWEGRFSALESRVRLAETDARAARRQVMVTWAVAATGCLFSFVAGASPEARAQFGVTLASLDTRLRAVETSVATQSARVTAVENKTQFVSVSGNDMYVTNANLHVRSGSGATDGAVNGRGNLIVGYNEPYPFGDGAAPGKERGGSHNLVLGQYHDFTSYGGIVTGQFNRVTAPYASVTVGYMNTASGSFASVSGGSLSTASGDYASVSGGNQNTASGPFASVTGGYLNVASAYGAAVTGGITNQATGDFASVSGGQSNMAGGPVASVSGGNSRSASAHFGWAAGSIGSAVSGRFSSQ